MSLVVIAAVDDAFEERVRRLLPRAFADTLERWDGPFTGPEDLTEVAERGPGVVILGPDFGEDGAFERARRLDRLYPSICLLIVADPGPDTWRRALTTGIRGIIAPDGDDEELRIHLEDALEVARLRDGARETSQPRVITVISPKGGSGKTVFSSNLAVGLAMRAPGQTVLVDLDLQFGDAAYALGLVPQHTMMDAVSEFPDLDATTLKIFLSRHASGLYTLCAPDQPAEGESIAVEQTSSIIELLASEFRYVVIDTAGGLGDQTLTALEMSTDIVLISDMDVPSVRNLRKALDALDLLGMTAAARHFVLNRANSRVGLDKAEIAAAAGIAVEIEIPSTRHVPISINEGVPLMMGNPRSPVSRAIAELVERLDRPTAPLPTKRWGDRQ